MYQPIWIPKHRNSGPFSAISLSDAELSGRGDASSCSRWLATSPCQTRPEPFWAWWKSRGISNGIQRSKKILSIYLSIYVSISISISISLYLSISIHLYLSISIYLYLYLSLYLSISLSLYLSISISISLYLSIYLYPSISIYIYLSISLSLYIYISFDCTSKWSIWFKK